MNKVDDTVRSFLFLPLLLITMPLFAQPDSLRFDHYGFQNGISQGTVIHIMQDRDGFFWMATQNGLNRFDGYRYEVFKSNIDDPNSLPDNSISRILEDDIGIWIGTNGSGLSLLEHDTQGFKSYDFGEDSLANRIFPMIFQGDDLLWLGTEAGLIRFSRKRRNYEMVPLTLNNGTQLEHGFVWSLLIDKHDNLWVGTDNGLLMRAPGEETFRIFTDLVGSENALDSTNVWSLEEDRDGSIWIGHLEGLDHYNPASGEVTHYSSGANIQIPKVKVWALMQDSQDILWVGTEGRGLFALDPSKGSAIQYRANLADPSSLGSDTVHWITEDRNGLIWVGTNTDGAAVIDRNRWHIEILRNQPDNPNSLIDTTIWSLAEDKKGTVWIGTSSAVSAYDPKLKNYRHYQNDPKDPDSLIQDFIIGLEPGKDGRIWAAGWGKGLDLLDPDSGKVVHYTPDPDDPGSLPPGQLTGLTRDHDGLLWVTTGANGIASLDETSNRFTHYQNDPGDPNSIPTNKVSGPFVDSRNRLWMGSSTALIMFESNRSSFRRFSHSPDNPKSLTKGIVVCINEDNAGYIWVSTAGGLNRLDTQSEEALRLLPGDGLPDSTIYSMAFDGYGDLWVGTGDGLARVKVTTLEIDTWYQQDGLQSNEFNSGAALVSSTDHLYFGGVNGISVFSPNDMQPVTEPVQAIITDFRLFNEPVPLSTSTRKTPLNRPIWRTDGLVLKHTDYLLSFNFSSLYDDRPERTEYSYRLVGLDNNWIQTDASRRFATYTNLSPSTYTFQVKATNKSGVWSEPTSIDITVLPPIWQTWWAYLFYVVVLVSLILLYLRYQARKLESQRQIAERERHISESLRQVDRLKDEFLANTSHELRTPLNGIIGLAESLIDGATGPLEKDTCRNLNMIVASGRRLSNLVNDVLDFSKLKNSGIEMNLMPVHIHSITEVVISLTRPLIGQRDLVIINEVHHELPPVEADENRLQQILYNLVGNAIKFTEHGSVRVAAEVEDKTMWVTVSDTGIGIDKDQQERIFNSFEQADGEATRLHGGTGLGLAITRKLVDLHNGEITVDSKPGEGSCFSFSLPLHEQADHEASEAPTVQLLREEVLVYTEEELTETPASANAFRIMVVDDEPVNRQVLRNHLRLRGYVVIEAEDGIRALEIIKEENVDLILLDVMMPRMSGYEVCDELRKTHPVHELPVIFLTARNQVADLKTGFAVGANDFLGKPIAREELLSRVRTHLDLLDTNRNLEEKVAERTRILEERNLELDARNQEILRTRDQLVIKEKMASLGTLTAGIAHEIRNPLTFVNGFAEISCELSDELKEDLHECAQQLGERFKEIDDTLISLHQNTAKIKEHGVRAGEIVQSMILLSRTDNGQNRPIGFNHLVHKFTLLALHGKGEDGKKNIELQETFDEKVGQMELCPQSFSRVLVNIANNAIESLQDRKQRDGREFKPILHVSTEARDDQVIVRFHDNGLGIKRENMDQLFTPFFTTRAGKEHVGLGLSMSFDIVVREHGGSLEIDSEEGSYTEVTISLCRMAKPVTARV